MRADEQRVKTKMKDRREMEEEEERERKANEENALASTRDKNAASMVRKCMSPTQEKLLCVARTRAGAQHLLGDLAVDPGHLLGDLAVDPLHLLGDLAVFPADAPLCTERCRLASGIE